MTSETLTVEEALLRAEQIDRNLDAFDETAPKAVAAMGGRDALARSCEMTCIGPIPRIDADHAVETRAVVAAQRAPPRQRRVPRVALRRARRIREPREGGVVGRDHADARAHLDAHVAQSLPSSHQHIRSTTGPAYSTA